VAAPDNADVSIHDTNDYSSFPDFEAQIEFGKDQNLSFTALINTLTRGSYVSQEPCGIYTLLTQFRSIDTRQVS
jgi:hypothetical protein